MTQGRFEIYAELSEGPRQAPKTRYRWRFQAGNNKIMADGGEAYASVANARRAIIRFANLSDDAPIVVLS